MEMECRSGPCREPWGEPRHYPERTRPCHFHAAPSELLAPAPLPRRSCPPVSPPDTRDEIVIFRKSYRCNMEEHDAKCEGDRPFVRRVQYTVTPVWTQLSCPKREEGSGAQACAEALVTLLGQLRKRPVPPGSDLARCLQCAFPRCHLPEAPLPRPPAPTSESWSQAGDAETWSDTDGLTTRPSAASPRSSS